MQLQGPARFAKLHSEIMNVVRGSVDSTCYAGIRKDKKKHGQHGDIWAFGLGCYSEFQCASHEHTGLAWGAIFEQSHSE